MFLNCSTCFERHTAHHRELKNCNCSLWFCIRLWLPAAVMAEWEPLSYDSCRQPQMYVNPEAAITVFELPMMSGVSLETCWTIKKHWNDKFYYTVASCLLFLYDFYSSNLSRPTALEGGECQYHAPAALYLREEPVPIVQEAGWASGPVWTGAKNLAPTEIRSPDRPANSQSLYRLRYPAHSVYKVPFIFVYQKFWKWLFLLLPLAKW